jgi:mannose-6-phosphate isomerase
MNMANLYPLRFEPIYQYRLWGGRRLSDLLSAPLPGNGPIGEAWVLSDRDDHQSIVADGPLKGQTISQLMKQFPEQLLGASGRRYKRFPLLLKFLDAHDMLSVQVHPSDVHADLLPKGETGKTEAWVVLESQPESRIYAGLKIGTIATFKNGTIEYNLASFTPKPGDGVFLPAGTVHALGGNVVVFEVQENSDVTFRLYDWGHIDAKTGKPRALQFDKALACIDFSQVAIGPVLSEPESAIPIMRERLFNCEHFCLWRLRGESSFMVDAAEKPRVLVCLAGSGQLEYDGANYAMGKGDMLLLPAVVGACDFSPHDAVNLLEITLPE